MDTTTSPGSRLRPERGAHVVPGPGGQRRARGGPAHDLGRPGQPGQPDRPPQRGLGDARAATGRWRGRSTRCPRRRRGRWPARPRPRPGAVTVSSAGAAPGQPPGQPVVRQHHPRRPGRGIRLVLGQPAQLGHGERRGRDAAGLAGPLLPGRPARRSAPGPAARTRTSFHSRAGLITCPASSTTTMPCCWAATPTASARSSSPSPAWPAPATTVPDRTRCRPGAARRPARRSCRRRPGRASPWWTAWMNRRQRQASAAPWSS